jgi:hypothetical protein
MGIVVVGRPAKHSDRLRHRINHDEAREKWQHPVGSGVTQRARGAGRRTRFIPVFRFTRLCMRILETWRLRNTTNPVRRQSCASAVIRVSDRRRVTELATEWESYGCMVGVVRVLVHAVGHAWADATSLHRDLESCGRVHGRWHRRGKKANTAAAGIQPRRGRHDMLHVKSEGNTPSRLEHHHRRGSSEVQHEDVRFPLGESRVTNG